MTLTRNNTLKRGTILLSFLFLAIASFSQAYFSKLLPGWENTNFFETDTSYFSFGMNNATSPYKNFIQISELNKLDFSVNQYKITLDTHTHTQLRSFTSNNFLQHNNSVFLIGDEFTTQGNGMLLKLTSHINSIDTFFLDTHYFDSRYSIIKSFGKDKLTVLGDYNLPSGKHNTFIKVMDTNGNLIWTNSFTVPWQNIHLHPKDIVKTTDGGFLLLCQEEEPEYQILGRSIKLFRTTLIKTDSTGNEQWRKHLGDERYNNKPNNFIKGEDDTTYYVGWVNSDSLLKKWYPHITIYDDWNIKDNRTSTLWISKINEGGIELWRKKFQSKITIPELGLNEEMDLPFEHYSPQMTKTSDNHLIAVAYGAWTITKISLKGKVLWTRTNLKFPDTLNWRDSKTWKKTIKETKDGGFIVGGAYWREVFPFSQNAYIIKLDQYGCIEPGCHTQDQWYLDSIAEAENKSNKGGEILLYPNPTHNQFTIKLPASYSFAQPISVIACNANGKKIDEFQLVDYTSTYSVNQLAIGLYLFRFSSPELGVVIRKVVVN